MNKITKWIIGIVIILLVIWLGYNLSNNKELVSNEPIKIGVALPLTGRAASYGEGVKNSFDLALEEINQEYFFKLELIYEDTQSEIDSTVSAVRKLIDINKVHIILGIVRSNNVLAVAPITEENKVILFTPIASAEDITQAGDYVFRTRETAKSHGIGIADFLSEKGVKKLALFVARSANSQSYAGFLQERFLEKGGSIVFRTDYDENNNDFRTDIAKAKNEGAEVFYISATLGNDGGIILRQIRESGFLGFVTGSVGIESDEFIKAAGSFADTIVYSSPLFDLNSKNTKEYADKYRAKYNENSDAFDANAYDSINLIAMAINECLGDKSDCIKDYLYQVKNYPGAGGLTTFDENGDVLKPIMIKTIKNGEFVPYEE